MAVDIQAQVNIARSLYSSLGKMHDNLNNVNNAFQNQTALMTEVASALNKAAENFNRINTRLLDLNKQLEKSLEDVSKNEVLETAKELGKNQKSLEKEVKKALKEQTRSDDKSLVKARTFSRRVFRGFSRRVSSAQTSLQNYQNTLDNATEASGSLSQSAQELSEAAREEQRRSSGGGGGLSVADLNPIKIGLSIAWSLTKFIFKAMKAVIGATFQLLKSIMTLPFQVAKIASQAGNALRKDVIETLGNAYQESKNLFDATSNIGKAALSMRNYAVGSLKSMQSAHSDFTKIFGFGTQAGAAFQKFLHDATNSMGHFAELFGPAIMSSGQSAFHFIKTVKTLGLTNEQIGYFAQDAAVHSGDLFLTLRKTINAIDEHSKSSGLDFKQLSLNFNKLRTNIIDFGHLTSDVVLDMTEKATKMGVKVDELTNIFKKFTTFEDAATTSAKLFQSFGMGVDALQLLTASNPGEILEMLSDAMQATGRSFNSLSRHEKKLMQQTTGLSAETLKSIMNYRAQGLTFEEARQRVQENDPTEDMTKTVKGLTSAIKEIQKVMEFSSPFDAFLKGIKMNMLANGRSIQSLTGLSEAYDNLYHFGLTLDRNSFESILSPVIMVLEQLHAIFTGPAFLGTLSLATRAVGDLVQNVTRDFSGNKATRSLQDIYDKMAALAYDKPGHGKAFITVLEGQINNKKFDNDLREYLIKSGILNRSTNKIVSGVGYNVALQTLINAGNKFPNSSASINKIVTAVNGQFNTQAANGVGWSYLGFRGRVERVKESLRSLWKKSSPWVKDVFALGGRLMGSIVEGFVVGLTAMFKLMSGDVDDFYQNTDGILYKTLEKAAKQQGKGNLFKQGKYSILDFLGITEVYNQGLVSRLSKSLATVIASPQLYRLLGKLAYAIFDALKPVVKSLFDIVLTQIGRLIGEQDFVTRQLIKIKSPELYAATQAAQSKAPDIAVGKTKKVLQATNKSLTTQIAASKKSGKPIANADRIEFDVAKLQTIHESLQKGEFDDSDLLAKVGSAAAGLASGVGAYTITGALQAAGSAVTGLATTLGITGAAGTTAAAAGSTGILATAGSAIAGFFSLPVVAFTAATVAVGGGVYLLYDYLGGKANKLAAKTKKAKAQTNMLKEIEKNFLSQLKIKEFKNDKAKILKDRFNLAKSQMSFRKGMIDPEDASSYPAGYLYPAYVVSDQGLDEIINSANYRAFGKDSSNISKLKDGIIKSIPGKGLVLYDGFQKIIFDPSDTVELIASKKGGALLQYFDEIDKNYTENLSVLKSRLFDNSEKTIALINEDIKQKKKLIEVLDQADKVVNNIISYSNNRKKSNIKVAV